MVGLAVGPCMTIIETAMCGHFLEGVKVRRQITGLPYSAIAPAALRGGWLRGYWPWGILQATTKGLPVLCAQRASDAALTVAGVGGRPRDVLSSVVAGAAQALFATPTQRLKTLAWTARSRSDALAHLRAHSAASLFRGVGPMVLRRGLDWGIRVGVVHGARGDAGAHRRRQGAAKGGDGGGDGGVRRQGAACLVASVLSSSVSMPFDNLVARRQASPRDALHRPRLVDHARAIFAAEGLRHGLYRGWLVRLVDSTHHTFWVLVVGGHLVRLLDRRAHD